MNQTVMRVLNNLCVAVFFAIILVSYKKDDINNNQQNRAVRYENSGNYKGKLNFVYTDEAGSFQTVTNVSLPWNKSFIASTTMQSAALPA